MTRTLTHTATSRELVAQTLRFESPARLPYDFPEPYGSDFYWADMSPSPDNRPPTGVDEWGAVWENIGVSLLGQVKDYPLKDWANFGSLRVPDINEPHRWAPLQGLREQAGDRFILAQGVSIYERLHFIRGLHNTWTDIYDAPEKLGELIDILVEQNLVAVRRFAELGADGFIFCDDWGLQNSLMIAPAKWREIWKPRYARIYQAAHAAGLFTFLHSCGYIVDILDDLIEIGLDAVHMDQQENMGLELLGRRFGGRITFFAPVDIQKTMIYGSLDDIRAYCHRMVQLLGRPQGGIIPRWYTDPAGAGHRQEAVDAMCQEFLRMNSAVAL
jgi:uroporphyrinogen decarboxylase